MIYLLGKNYLANTLSNNSELDIHDNFEPKQ